MDEKIISKKKIMKLSVPTIISLSSTTVMGLVSLWIVGFLGYKEVAIVGLINIFCQNVILILTSMAHQITVVVSKKTNLRIELEIDKTVYHGLLAVILFVAPILCAIIVLLPLIMPIIGFTAEMSGIGYTYFIIRIVAILFIALSRVLLGTLRGLEKTKLAMYATIIANVTNVIFSLLMVRWLGLIGLGFSLIIAEIIQYSVLYSLLRLNGYLKGIIDFKALNVQDSKNIFVEGVKIGLQDIGITLTLFFFSIFAAKIGVKELAATEIVLNILSFSYLPGIAVGIVAATEVGKVRGSYTSNKNDVLKMLKNNLLVSVAIFTVPIAIVIGIFGESISGIFVKDMEIIQLSSHILSVVVWFMLFDAFQMVMMDANRGFENNTGLVFIALGLGVLFFGPFSYFVTFILNFGIMGTWISFYIYIILQFVVLNRKYILESKRC